MILAGTTLLFAAGAVPLSAQAPAAPERPSGEAGLVLPDLSQVSFHGIDGHTLLLGGILICVLGLLFGLVICGALVALYVSTARHLAAARESLEKALAIEPDLPEALSARSVIETNFDYNWKGATETLRKALALAPEDPALLMEAGNLAAIRGDVAQGQELVRHAVSVDPVNALARAFYASSLSAVGHYQEARAEYARVIELNPSAPNSHASIGFCYLLEGKFDEAVAVAEHDSADWARLLVVSSARWGQKRVTESDAALRELIAKYGETAAYQIAEVYGYRNDKDHAFEWLERARRQHDGGLPSLRKDPLLTNLHDDPRWNAFLHTMGLADDQLKPSGL
jgi:serine/threonine-protein kinase